MAASEEPKGGSDVSGIKMAETPPPESPAGPHAREELTDNDKTPGAGTLPEPREGEVDPGAG